MIATNEGERKERGYTIMHGRGYYVNQIPTLKSTGK